MKIRNLRFHSAQSFPISDGVIINADAVIFHHNGECLFMFNHFHQRITGVGVLQDDMNQFLHDPVQIIQERNRVFGGIIEANHDGFQVQSVG